MFQLDFLADSYGGKRAWLTAVQVELLARAGAWRRFRAIDFARVRRTVFVCMGNICRSPYAEARLRMLGEASASAGINADEDKPAHPPALAMAARRGVDLSAHRSTPLTRLAARPGDLLVGFEVPHALALERFARGRDGLQVTLLGCWGQPRGRMHIEDPYGRSQAYFDTCFSQIDVGVSGLAARLARVPDTR